ncbi:MAG: histidine phosphatase family protein [Atopobiaceae bacterium]
MPMGGEGERASVLVMRHPETEANVSRCFAGRRDVLLTPRGEEQRKRAVEAVIAWRPDRIWCSPLARCLCIAAPAAETLGIEVEIDDRLQEIEFGELESKGYDYAAGHGYTFPWPIDSEGVSHPCPGAESFEDLLERAGSLLASAEPLDGRTAMITHGGFTRALLGSAFGSDLGRFWHMTIRNVASQILTTDHEGFYLDAFGLTPEEVVRRSAAGALGGGHSTKGPER